MGVPGERRERNVEEDSMTKEVTLSKFSSYAEIIVRDPKCVTVDNELSIHVNSHDAN